MDKWSWDREHIRRFREIHEPYDDYERFMLEKARVNPFWVEMWASQGNVEKRVLPSGLTVLTKRGEDSFEQYVLTDSGEALDFSHEPKDYHIRLNKPMVITPELIEKVKWKLAKTGLRFKKHC
ncbi:MAG: hypothetical protein QXD73_04415 [Candidatus Bathyarchaeia archaeon]